MELKKIENKIKMKVIIKINKMEIIKFKYDHYLELYNNSYKICFVRS